MLERLKQTAMDGGNVFEVLVDAVRVCSLGQITQALFEVGGQYRDLAHLYFAGVWIKLANDRTQGHALDTQVAELGAGRRKPVIRCVAEIFDVALRRERRKAVADRAFATETCFALKGFGELAVASLLAGDHTMPQQHAEITTGAGLLETGEQASKPAGTHIVLEPDELMASGQHIVKATHRED